MCFAVKTIILMSDDLAALRKPNLRQGRCAVSVLYKLYVV